MPPTVSESGRSLGAETATGSAAVRTASELADGGLEAARGGASGSARPTKRCVACGLDCSQRPRIRDPKGRYVCREFAETRAVCSAGRAAAEKRRPSPASDGALLAATEPAAPEAGATALGGTAIFGEAELENTEAGGLTKSGSTVSLPAVSDTGDRTRSAAPTVAPAAAPFSPAAGIAPASGANHTARARSAGTAREGSAVIGKPTDTAAADDTKGDAESGMAGTIRIGAVPARRRRGQPTPLETALARHPWPVIAGVIAVYIAMGSTAWWAPEFFDGLARPAAVGLGVVAWLYAAVAAFRTGGAAWGVPSALLPPAAMIYALFAADLLLVRLVWIGSLVGGGLFCAACFAL